MEKILFIAHTQKDRTLPKVALESLKAAVDLSKALTGSVLTIGLIGDDLSQASASTHGSGAVKIIGVEGNDFASSRYSSDVKAIEALTKASEATLVIAPATHRFNRSMPGASFRTGGRIDTHVSGIKHTDGKLFVERWYYRQRMMAEMTREQRPWFILIDAGVFKPYEANSTESAPIELVEVVLDDNQRRTSVLGYESPKSDAQTIRPDAGLLFVAGAGWTKKQQDGQTKVKEAASTILEFLNQSKASLGSSKSLADQSGEGQDTLPFLSHLNQVGQTGTTPRHPKGLASCCHGEEPHVVGWRFINERRVINTNPGCGWAQGKADVVYVADAFKVVSEINKILAGQTASVA